MAGSPKKRARRLALEAARAKAGLPILPPKTFTAQPPVDDGWVDIPTEPTKERRYQAAPKARATRDDGEQDPIVAILEEGYREQADRAVAAASGEGPGGGDVVLTAHDQKFNQLRELALDSAIEIMQIKLDPEHKSFEKLLARKTTIAAAVMTTSVRVEPSILRGKVRDKVDEILRAIKVEEQKPN